MGQEIGFNFSEFSELISQLELVSKDVEEIVELGLENATKKGIEVFKKYIPLSDLDNPQGHARDNVIALSPFVSKKGIAYKKITFNGDRSYLYILDYGSSTLAPMPWRKRAYRAVRTATAPIVRATIINELNRRLER